MPGQCCHHCDDQSGQRQPVYRRLLWVALSINLAMFAVEVLTGLRSGSASLLADSLDFLGDAANYGISLFVLGSGLAIRAYASRLKAISMLGFGVWVLGLAAWHLYTGRVPSAPTMGVVGAFALLANGAVAALLFRFRDGDSNMRSVWLCTRNDVLGNIAVLLAALGVFGTASVWPDLAVAATMSLLALTSAVHILRQSGNELRGDVSERSAPARH
ncbi:cation transporter [Paraburkholderia sp. SOS3]|uniref:cation transporter n=1 Tax=Paraburkholderia sp. SOS3 TaxID=1926494 RepID=UPI00094757C8|nr:cation transporter [Paraburkholderia sp. SOS3]APR38173.1 cation transporter [Paraburkholderia sp. SOS3]